MDIEVYPPDRLRWQARDYRCVLGKGGVRADKREGDGATPIGHWPIRSVLYRADRLTMPKLAWPCQSISRNDGWCDDQSHPNYNRRVEKPFGASHEDLWRDDHVYDLIVVLGHNDAPPEPGRGSAIFMHVAKPDFSPTEGCVALALDDLLGILAQAPAETAVLIHPLA